MQNATNLRDNIGTLPTEPESKRRIRFHQGWWRAFVLNEEQGQHPVRAAENVCNTILNGKLNQKNFLSASAFKSVEQTMAERKKFSAGMFNEDRLFNNLLSSQPLAFNFFGELKQDLDFARTAMSCFIPGISRVTNVLFEFAPIANYSSDNSAFDVAIEMELKGKKGLFGIECKYTDSFSEKEYNKESYRQIYDKSTNFKEPYANFVKARFNQLFRNQLIAESLVQNNHYDFVYTGLFCYQLDNDAIETGYAFQNMLNNGSDFFNIISYSDFITALQKQDLTWLQREWTMLLWARYCGMNLSENAYKS